MKLQIKKPFRPRNLQQFQVILDQNGWQKMSASKQAIRAKFLHEANRIAISLKFDIEAFQLMKR